MQSTTLKRASAQDAGRLTGLIQNSAAYQGPYASMISGYRRSWTWRSWRTTFGAGVSADFSSST